MILLFPLHSSSYSNDHIVFRLDGGYKWFDGTFSVGFSVYVPAEVDRLYLGKRFALFRCFSPNVLFRGYK